MPFLQIPPPQVPQAPPAVVQRRIRAGERFHYGVVSDWNSPSGRAHYEYRMELQVEKTKEKKVVFTVLARISDLTAVYDGTETHTRDAGVIPMKWGAGGPPEGIAAGGQITTFAIPLLAFTAPESSPGPDGSFMIPAFRVERVGAFGGSGHVETNPRGETITIHLTLGDAAGAPVLDIRSQFRPGGQLRHAEGAYTEAAGTFKFVVDGR